MNPGNSSTIDVGEEIPALIETLLATEQRLEELTGGEVDTVASRDGRTFLLRRAQEQLRFSEAAKQRAILNALPANIALLDADGGIVSVNETWRQFGTFNELRAPEHGVGLNYLDICDGAKGDGSLEAKKVAVGIRSVLDGMESGFSTEYPCNSPTEERWFQLTVTPLAGGAVVMHLNITERKQAERASQQSEKRLRDIFDGLGPTMFVGLLTPEGTLIEVNQAPLTAAGLKPEDVLGRPFEETPWWAHSKEVQQQLREAITRAAGGEPSRYDVHTRGAENQVIDIDFSLQPLRDETGKVVFLIPSGSVITERKRAENALRESNENFHLLADNLTDAFWIRSPDLSEVQYISPAFEQIWGRPVELLYASPQKWADLIMPEDRERVLSLFATLNGDAPSLDIEYRIVRPDNEIRWVRVRAFQVRDGDGKVIRITGIVTDITDRRHSEEKVRKTEELYRRAIAGAGAVPYSSDYKTKSYLFMGDGIQQLIGYSPTEVTGQLWKQIIQESVMTGDTVEFSKEEASRRMTVGDIENWRCDMRILTRDGKSRWLSDSAVQSLDQTGQVIGSTGILQDITERKLAEISLMAFSKLSRDLSSASSAKEAGQLIIDISDTLLTWDCCWISLYDSDKDVMRPVLHIDTFDGKRFTEPPIDSEPVSDLQKQILGSGGQLILRENTDTFLSGTRAVGDTTRPSASLMFVPIRYRNRNVGVLSIQSYTPNAYTKQNLATLQSLADQCGGALERISADEALRNSEEKFRHLADHISDTFWIAPPDFKGMHYVSAGFEKIWGRLREHLYAHPKDWEDSLHPEDRERVFTDFALLMKGQLEVSLEYRIIRPDGTVRWIHDRGFQVRDADGKLIRLTGIASDITERKTAEAALEKANRQLREASRLAGMSEVATSVLHNVGNVLNSVNVSCSIISDKVRKTRISSVTKTAELLREHAGDLSAFLTNDQTGKKLPEYLSKLAVQLAKEQKAVLDEVKSLSTNIEHIKSIIDMQQTHAKNLGGNREDLPIQALLEDALRLNEGALSRHRIKVVREFFDAPIVLVEKHKVLQILVNLLGNAKHALSDSGREDKQIILRIASSLDGVAISVIDNGIGIPPENLTRIFGHRFTTKKEGHGFGLHSAAIAAQEMGGSLAVKSDGSGTGATFTLLLPLDELRK